LFTDKTGTLTQGQLSVACIVRGDGYRYEDPGKAAGDADYWRILHTSLQINNAAEIAEGKPVGGNSTDRALLRYLMDLHNPGVRVTKGKVIPFLSETKFMATDVTGDYNLTLIRARRSGSSQAVRNILPQMGWSGRLQAVRPSTGQCPKWQVKACASLPRQPHPHRLTGPGISVS
jgi:magnesium-transporting ATPase (P-type)